MPPYQARVVTEQKELEDKRQKLATFIGNETFPLLDEVERNRLLRQLYAMTLYSGVLRERIDAFGKEESPCSV